MFLTNRLCSDAFSTKPMASKSKTLLHVSGLIPVMPRTHKGYAVDQRFVLLLHEMGEITPFNASMERP